MSEGKAFREMPKSRSQASQTSDVPDRKLPSDATRSHTTTEKKVKDDIIPEQKVQRGRIVKPDDGRGKEKQPAGQQELKPNLSDTQSTSHTLMQRTEVTPGERVENTEAMLAKRAYKPRNPLNPYNESIPRHQPKDTKNNIGNNVIEHTRAIEDQYGNTVRVEWSRNIQKEVNELGGIAVTFNKNKDIDPEYMGAHLVVVGLGPDATNAAAYEEYLHVKAAESRGWAVTKTTAEHLFEEVRVERQVLANAHNLHMFHDEFDKLVQIRQTYYVEPLQELYERFQRNDRTLNRDEKRYIKSHQKEIEAYLYGEYSQVPAKPDGLPVRSIK